MEGFESRILQAFRFGGITAIQQRAIALDFASPGLGIALAVRRAK
jgi:hypothetical protein